MKYKKFNLTILGILLISLGIVSNHLSGILLTSEGIHNKDDFNLKSAGFWNLTGNPILIDNTNPSKNWSYSASHYDWCSGSGIWTDPYLIENITIDGQSIGSCIEIRNSNAYFVINNCTLYGSGTTDYGIYLNYTNNGKIINNNCSVYSGGIYLDYSNNNTVLGNDATNNQYGIVLNFSNNTIISGNSASNNMFADIAIAISRNATLTENILSVGGKMGINFGGVILYSPSSKEEVASHTIDTTNLMNNKPIYYYANEIGLQPSDFLNAGQIILANCNDSLISNVNISNVYEGISILYGNNNTISNNFLENVVGGFMSYTYTNNTVISENTIKNCLYYGIGIGSGSNIIISKNVIENSNYGIYFSYILNSTISGNIFSNNEVGIALLISNNTEISKNSVERNIRGIVLSQSNDNTISKNIIRNNKEYGITISEWDGGSSNRNFFFQNSFLNNSIHAYDGGINNYWNNSIIGNYWDNYTGIDANSDGVGDTPHTFQNGTDYLPIVDITAPTIVINAPISLEVFGESAPNFNVEITDLLLDTMWYTIDNGVTNTTFTSNGTINQALWNALPEGNITIRFYAKDSVGNIGFQEVTVVKTITQPSPPGIPGYNILFLLGIVSTISVIIVKKRLKYLN